MADNRSPSTPAADPVIIGSVVRLHERLAWFGEAPTENREDRAPPGARTRRDYGWPPPGC